MKKQNFCLKYLYFCKYIKVTNSPCVFAQKGNNVTFDFGLLYIIQFLDLY